MKMMRGWLMLQWWGARLGIVRTVVAMMCLVAAALGGVLVPHLRMQENKDLSAVVRLKKQLLSPVITAAESAPSAPDHREIFYHNLGDSRHAEQQLKTLFELAQKNTLRLSAAEYKSTTDKNSRVRTLQITLPIKAPYSAIRQFSEQVLLAMPFASLDELRFKRDNIGSPSLEAHLRFSLYLLESPAKQSARELAP